MMSYGRYMFTENFWVQFLVFRVCQKNIQVVERVQNRKYLFSDEKGFIIEKFSFLYIYKFE